MFTEPARRQGLDHIDGLEGRRRAISCTLAACGTVRVAMERQQLLQGVWSLRPRRLFISTAMTRCPAPRPPLSESGAELWQIAEHWASWLSAPWSYSPRGQLKVRWPRLWHHANAQLPLMELALVERQPGLGSILAWIWNGLRFAFLMWIGVTSLVPASFQGPPIVSPAPPAASTPRGRPYSSTWPRHRDGSNGLRLRAWEHGQGRQQGLGDRVAHRCASQPQKRSSRATRPPANESWAHATTVSTTTSPLSHNASPGVGR